MARCWTTVSIVTGDLFKAAPRAGDGPVQQVAVSPRRPPCFPEMSLADTFEEFLTLPAYEILER